MSTRLLYSLTDDKPGMQKQIGCMNGIFHLFDRQSFLSGRRLNGHNPRRLLAGQDASVHAEEDGVSQKSAVKNSKATKFERHRLSSDSSRSSVSSSCNSSSFSSLEENRPAKLEPSLLRLTTTQYNQPHDSLLHDLNASEHLSVQSPVLSDIAKGSSYRESHGASLRPPAKDKSAILTYMDSPRPLHPSKSVKPKSSYVSESLGVLPNLHRPQTSAEQMDIDSFCSLSKRDTPRFSYDGRESRDVFKSNFKVKELPRHSLDSKRGSMSLPSQSQSRYSQGNHQSVNHSISQTVNSPRPQGSHARQSSVVAKLMGLEALPDSMSNSELQVRHSRTNSIEAFDPFSVSLRTLDGNKPALLSGSPRKSQRSAISQKEVTADSVMQFNPSSQFPIQATAWKRLEGSQSPAVPVPESTASHSKASNATLSVYGEIERRLAQLEFKKSGKDLRALKQILGAMQKSKETSENKNDVQASESMLQTNSCGSGSKPRVAPCGNIKSEAPDSPKIKKISSPKNLQSPIVEKLKVPGSPVNSTSGLAKLRISPSSRRKSVEQQQNQDLTPRKVSSRQPHFLDRRIGSRNTLTLAGDHQRVSENTGSCANSGTSIPRLTLKESRATDAQRTRNPAKQTKEPRSPGRTPKSKTNHMPLSSDRANKNSSHTRDLSDETNTISLQSAASMDSQDDTEVSSVYSFAEIRGMFPPDDQTRKKTVPLREKELSRKPGIPTTEQPSPVSVLDASYFEDETPSPVKMTSAAFKDDDVSGEVKWNLQQLSNFSDSNGSSFGSAINRNSLVNHPLAQTEIQVISTNQGSGTAFPIENTSSDHAYISEILSATGLLSDLDSELMTIRLHSSGDLISGNLFHTLEQTKASYSISSGDQARECTVQSKRSEKMRRKLIFDVVSEILVHRVVSDHSRNWFSLDNLVGKKATQQRLLKGLCSEIDQLQTDRRNCRFNDDEDDGMRTILSKDLTHQELNWTGSNDISGLVLDVERLIFKDLISEVVSNLATRPRPQPTGHHRRQLVFT